MTSEYNRPINAGIRLATMVMDHFFMTFIAMIFYFPVLMTNFATGFKISHDEENVPFMSGPLIYIGLFGFALYSAKTCSTGAVSPSEY